MSGVNLLIEQSLVDGGGLLQLTAGVHFIWMPLLFSLLLGTLLLLLGRLPKNLVSSAGNQVKQAVAKGGDDLMDQVKQLAELYVAKLHSNRKIFLLNLLAEAVVLAYSCGFFFFISTFYGSPFGSPYPSSFNCLLLMNPVRDSLVAHDQIITKCSLPRSQYYTYAYGKKIIITKHHHHAMCYCKAVSGL